jgi:hypothetical protein
MSDLYSFNKLNCDNPGAPKLVPASSFTSIANGNNNISLDALLMFQSGLIDVVNNFQWSNSPPNLAARVEVPGITLREKKLRTNAIISAAFYYLASASSSLGTLKARLDKLAPGLSNLIGSAGSSVINSAAITNATAVIEQSLLNSAALLTTGNSDIRDILSRDIEGLNSEYLRSYEGLYITEDTKFTYYLPYFTDQVNLVNNSFDESDATFNAGTNYSKGVEKIRAAAEALARFANFSEPGIYIERPKFYSFPSTGDTIQVKFPLINTGHSTYDDVRRNWQFVFLITYQNRPNRRSRELIDPACIYEVSIPGVKYMPYAYMENIKIDFLGSRRQMEIEVPTETGKSTISTIIPEAYSIDLTLRGLVGESQNFLAAMLQDKQNIVSVSEMDRFNPFGEIFNSFESSLRAETNRIR